ncbi:MAG TPA: hypothetical protein VKP65_20355 [Rhodothermales bacterium]|nr:hypothetical protein [Rhodothermales bacterium]
MANTRVPFQFIITLGADLKLTAGTATFYGLSDGQPEDLGSLAVDAFRFTMDLDRRAYTYFYVVLRVEACDAGRESISVGDREVLLLSVFKRDDEVVSLGERETIANTFCFARFARSDRPSDISIAASDRDMGIMCGMRDNFIAVDGNVSDVISQSPNGKETNSYAMFNFLSNLLYYCIQEPETYEKFLDLSAASSTCQAFLHMVLHPWDNVQEIYDLISDETQVYEPSLPDMYKVEWRPDWSPVPNQWTLTVKVNDSGAQNFLIGGPGYIAFDENDRAWLTNNSTQGSPNSSSYCVVLNADGSPAPFSPVFGGGLLGGGFGVTANADGSRIYLGNYGWGPRQYNPQTGSISVSASDGKALSPPNGYTQGLSRVQGLIYDQQGNLWITSWGTQDPMAPSNETIYNFVGDDSAMVVYLNFDGRRAPSADEVLVYTFEEPSRFHCTFDVVVDSQGNAFVSNAGGTHNGRTIPSSVYKLRINTEDPRNPYLECLAKWVSYHEADRSADEGEKPTPNYETFRQINVNSKDEVFVAAVKSGCVLQFDNDLTHPPVRYTHNIGRPWGITFDEDDTMYVANFFSLHEAPPAEGEKDVRGHFGVTVIRNDDETTAKLMTLPTGGVPVTLANGFGLYGSGGPPCYQPLSRLTGTVIDRVGNLWAVNNWKPSAYIDFEANPGGDGVVIFFRGGGTESVRLKSRLAL